MPNENLPLIEKILAATVGSGIALVFLPGNWQRKLFMFLGGFATAWYIGPIAAAEIGMQESAAGYLIGFVSMAVADGFFRAWYALDLPGIASSWLRRK